jgi:hypothetical protein
LHINGKDKRTKRRIKEDKKLVSGSVSISFVLICSRLIDEV